MKLSIKGFFSKSDQILRKPRIWSHLLKKSLTDSASEYFEKLTFKKIPKDPTLNGKIQDLGQTQSQNWNIMKVH